MRRSVLPCLFLILSLCGCVSSNPHATLEPADQIDIPQASKLTRTMAQELLSTAQLPGFSIAIAKDGRIVFAEGFGFADLETGRKVTADTQFRAASVSKIITATALATLLESGHLTLDSPIHDYAPEYPNGKRTLTVRQLAAHLGGVPHYSDQDNNRTPILFIRR